MPLSANLVTFNAFLGNSGRHPSFLIEKLFKYTGIDYRKNFMKVKEDRFQYFKNHYLQQYDIVCLQEIFGVYADQRRKKELIEYGKSLGFVDNVYTDNYSIRPLQPNDGGLLTMSKYPIVEKEAHLF
jgi:hypothetical protein